MKRYLLIAAVTLLLTGCPTMKQLPQTPPDEQQPISVIEMPPKTLDMTDWSERLSPLADNLLSYSDVNSGSYLLLDEVKNKTNGYIAIGKVTDFLNDKLSSNYQFILIDKKRINEAKLALGLPADDSLSSRSKAIGLARYLQAQYVLYTTLTGDVNEPIIAMQLMLASTGEIIWSESTN